MSDSKKMFVSSINERVDENGKVSTMIIVKSQLSTSSLFSKLGVGSAGVPTGTIWAATTKAEVQEHLNVGDEISAEHATWGENVADEHGVEMPTVFKINVL